MKETNDLRIVDIKPLVDPLALKHEYALNDACAATVAEAREVVSSIIKKRDRRMLAVVGPCSIHDPKAAYEYAERISALRKRVADRIFVVMRVYFEKPRTTTGWRGLITDPYLNGEYDISQGLKIARKLLLDITKLGVPIGSEVLDPIVPQYISDLISWAAIGARTTESQIHRELASGLSMPVGFKNGTDGNLQTAINALESSRSSHSFIGIDQNGRTCVLRTRGNDDVHIILRGGRRGPNYEYRFVQESESLLSNLGVEPAILVDCSHDNSGKNHRLQSGVMESILDSVSEQRSRGNKSIIGFMIESNLFEGNQKIPANLADLKYGVSITDECVGWETTERMLLHAHERLERSMLSEVDA